MAQMTTRHWREPFGKNFIFTLKRKMEGNQNQRRWLEKKNVKEETPWKSSFMKLELDRWPGVVQGLGRGWQTILRAAPLGRGVRLPAASRRGLCERPHLLLMPRLGLGFSPHMITGLLPPVTSAYKVHSRMRFHFLIYFLKEWVSEQPFQASGCWLACSVLNSTGHSWMRVCPSWKSDKQSSASTFSLPRYRLLKGKGERWAEFEKRKIPCQALYYAHLLC